jgi:hypothetical protein
MKTRTANKLEAASQLPARHTGAGPLTRSVGWDRIMRYKLCILALLFQISGAALAAGGESPPDFSGKYPPVLGFLRCINLHTNAARNLQQTNFLVITEFYRMDRIGGDMLRYVVAEDGQTVNSIDDGTGTAGDPHRKRLSKAELKQLRSAADKLSTTNQYPWLQSLVIVSHRNGTNWVTHSYARHRADQDPPESPALRRLLNLVGERPEAQEVHAF